MDEGIRTADVVSLSLARPVEKVGPLRTRLPAADPEHCRYSNHQGHQIFHHKQGEVGTVELCCLKHTGEHTNHNRIVVI